MLSDPMSETPERASESDLKYERYRPRMYQPRMSIFWWASKKPYVLFILRELTSIFVAAYAVLLIFQLRALNQGPEAYEALMTWFASPVSIGLHAVIFLFVIYHSITWFKLAPKATVIKIGKKYIPGEAIIAGNILGWIVLSVAIAWLILSV